MENALRMLSIEANILLSDKQITQLVGYVRLLDKWNKAYNLTSVRDPDEMLIKHILDSLVVGPHLVGDRFIDVGTGPGLPGIPLAILYPERQFTLLDSLGKRIRFIRQVLHELDIHNVEAIQSRVEAFLPELPFDGVLSRAFASLSDMVSWCQHLTSSQGHFYALKGVYDETEANALPNFCRVQQVISLSVPKLEDRKSVV